MKLTVIDKEVIFDYSDINTSSLINSPDYLKKAQAREFLLRTACDWEPTMKSQVVRMLHSDMDWATPYGNAKQLKFLLNNCEVNAMYLKAIEIAPEFEAYLIETEKRCKALLEIEIVKEKARERQAKWESICKYGCGNCKNLCYYIDQPICNKTGKELKEMSSPVYSGKTLILFNLVPIPAQDCPFAIRG